MKGTPLVGLKDPALITRAYNLGLKIVPNLPHMLTIEGLCYWENNLGQLKERLEQALLVDPTETTKTFTCLVDLGIITVPDDYDHKTYLAKFFEKSHENFRVFNRLTDSNPPPPARILKPGDELHVRAFTSRPGTTYSFSRAMSFLSDIGAVHTGAQGLSLVIDQKFHMLPEDHEYVIYDVLGRRWRDDAGNVCAPSIYKSKPDQGVVNLANVVGLYGSGRAFLCFTEVK